MPTLSQTAQRTQNWLSNNGALPRRAGLVISIMMFAAGLIWSLQVFPGSVHTLQVWPLSILLFACVPLTTVLNVAEFQMMSRMAGARVDWAQSFETTIYASAANMLPLPGGVIARVAALKAHGATVRFGSLIVVLFAGIWGAIAFCYSGAWLAVLGHQQLGGLFASAGIGLLTVLSIAAIRIKPQPPLILYAFVIRVGSLLVDVLRQMLAIWALGVFIGFGEASVFSVSSFVGSAVSIVPAGLGVREIVVAALSPLIALPVAVGFLSAAVNRAVGMAGLIILAFGLTLRRGAR